MNNARAVRILFFVKNSFVIRCLGIFQVTSHVSYMKRGFLFGTKLPNDCAMAGKMRARSAFLGNVVCREMADLFHV
jgi:hypothetical protein